MFDKIADFIIRRHKLVIIIWVLALLAALPLAPMVNSVLQYEETDSGTMELESVVAQEFIGKHFGNSSEQPSTLIVLTTSDARGEQAKEAVYNIQRELFNASHLNKMPAVKVESAYTVAELYAIKVLAGLNIGYNEVNQTTYVVYGLPADYRTAYNELNMTAWAIYGLPDAYTLFYVVSRADPEITVDEADDIAYSGTKDVLEYFAGELSPEQLLMAELWLDDFSAEWNQTKYMSDVSQAMERRNVSYAAAFEPFVDDLPVPLEEKVVLLWMNQTTDFANFDDFHHISALAKALVDEMIDVEMSDLPEEERALVHAYFGTFYHHWNATSGDPDQTAFEGMIDDAVTEFSAVLPEPERSIFLAIQSGLGYGGYNNTSVRHNFVVSLVATMAGSLRPEHWVVDAAARLGPIPNPFALEALSDRIVENSTLSTLPFMIPEEIVRLTVSEDNTTMLIALVFDAKDAAHGKAAVPMVRQIVHDALGARDIRAYVTGSDPISADIEETTFRDLEVVEPVTITLVLVLIGLYFRSFVASSVPPLSIGLALGITYALVYLVGYFVLPIHYSVLTLLLSAMMGAGCDYCIFILSRYREERSKGLDQKESVRQAVTWAGESIATSGATVIIGFGVLSIGQFPMFKSMGISLALGVTIALLVALTMLPSLLVLLGDRMFWPSRLNKARAKKSKPSYFTRSAHFAIKHAKAIVLVAVIISIPTTYLAATLHTSYDYVSSMPETESKDGLGVLQDSFGAGRIMPTQIALAMSEPVLVNGTFNDRTLLAIDNTSKTLLALDNVKSITSPTYPNGEPIGLDPANLSAYESVILTMLSADGPSYGRAVLITVTFADQPFAQGSIQTIEQIRGLSGEIESSPLIDRVYVGGATASMFDISNLVQSDFSNMEVLVVVGIYVVLLVVLGSVINPLRSILTILLSISWTLAATLLLFHFLGQTILYMVPMILLIVCLGLGMDYDILLTTRIREEAAKGMSTNEAIVHGVEKTGGIITACGIIMAAAFGSMMLSNGYLLKEFGFALMFAILLDATIVRIYLVPAIMSLLGKWNWWAPGPLARVNKRRDERRIAKVEPPVPQAQELTD